MVFKFCAVLAPLVLGGAQSDMEALRWEIAELSVRIAKVQERSNTTKSSPTVEGEILDSSARRMSEQDHRSLADYYYYYYYYYSELGDPVFENETGVVLALKDYVFELAFAMDSMWLVLRGALVMFMHAVFAMLETGRCRAKNASNVLMNNLVNVCVGTIGWYFFGWAFACGGPYDEDGMLEIGLIRSKQFAGGGFLSADEDGILDWAGANTMVAWFFQWAFCTAAATIVSGAVDEGVLSPTHAAYAFVMSSVIYPVVVAWT